MRAFVRLTTIVVRMRSALGVETKIYFEVNDITAKSSRGFTNRCHRSIAQDVTVMSQRRHGCGSFCVVLCCF